MRVSRDQTEVPEVHLSQSITIIYILKLCLKSIGMQFKWMYVHTLYIVGNFCN